MVNGEIDVEDLKFTKLTSKEAEDLQLQIGDLLLVRSNGSETLVGRSAVIKEQLEGYAYAGYLVRMRLFPEYIFPEYLHLAFENGFTRTQIEVPIRTTTGVKNINSTEISNLIIPLPPLAEQKRIVAKVEGLLGQCDELKAALVAGEGARVKVLESALWGVVNGVSNTL